MAGARKVDSASLSCFNNIPAVQQQQQQLPGCPALPESQFCPIDFSGSLY
jgi:hypothetical protein